MENLSVKTSSQNIYGLLHILNDLGSKFISFFLKYCFFILWNKKLSIFDILDIY